MLHNQNFNEQNHAPNPKEMKIGSMNIIKLLAALVAAEK
jgi:hypothetical protein